MPRYFFHAHDGVDAPDRKGTDLSSPDAARAHAMQLAARYVDGPAASSDGATVVIDVDDETGKRVLVIRLVATVEAA